MEDLAYDRLLLPPPGAVPASIMAGSLPEIAWPSGEDRASDPVIDALNAILQLAVARPAMPCAMFADRVRQAIEAHLRNKQAVGDGVSVESRSGLTGWQERRAKQYLTAHAGEDAPIAAAAEACKLSYSYFIKAFKTTT